MIDVKGLNKSFGELHILKDINECGTTVIMVTHEHNLVKYFGGRLINLRDGSVAYDNYIEGEGDEIYEDE